MQVRYICLRAIFATTVLSCAVALAISAQPANKIIEGRVIGVTDGDTVTVLDAKKEQHKIRLEGIDAPETGQAFGTKAKKELSSLIFGQQIRVEWQEVDKYGRTLGHIYLGDRWVNKELIAAGMAWHYKKYSSDERLSAAEQAARKDKVGLWADKEPVAPWDFRKGKSNTPLGLIGQTPPADSKQGEAIATTVYVTKSGGKYHLDGCRSLSKSKLPMTLDEAKKKYTPCSICKPPP